MGNDFEIGHLFLSNFSFLQEKFIKKVVLLDIAAKDKIIQLILLHKKLNTFTTEYLG